MWFLLVLLLHLWNLQTCPTARDHGCNGGLMNIAFSWVKKVVLAATEAVKPLIRTLQHQGCQGRCWRSNLLLTVLRTPILP